MARFGMLQAAFFLLPACAGHSIIPLDIEKQVDPTLSFVQVKEAPTTHQGKIIVLGGEILDATRLKEHTRLTVLQLPTGRNYEPAMDRHAVPGTLSCVSNRIFGSGHGTEWNPDHGRRENFRRNHRVA